MLLFLFAFTAVCAQTVPSDSAIYVSKFIWNKVDTILQMDFTGLGKPESPESCNPVFHFPPVRQDTTGTCWAFSGTSFVESELMRLSGKKVKLSEMYTVYWEYVEKARRFVLQKGNSNFGEGSEEDAVLLRMKTYGAVRAEDYTGFAGDQNKHNHRALFREMMAYLDFIKKNELWDEDFTVQQIRRILDKHLGAPPEKIQVNGKWMTPKAYMDKELKLPLDEYASFMSFISQPFYTQGEYKVEDNWWHEDSYYNVPLSEWYAAIAQAIEQGFSVAIGGDVSEPGKGRWDDVCVIPTFDIPQEFIGQSAREYRFYNQSSTDDHGIHLVGMQKTGGHDWFLIKDSGSSAYEGSFPGYYFYRDDFIKLKMLTFMVHRDAVKALLAKCQKKD